jgi:hypothetical protein
MKLGGLTKQRKIITCILVSTLLLYSCKRGKYYNLSGDERYVYKDGDTLIYKNDIGKMDSFLVYQLERGYHTQYASHEDKDKYEYQDFLLSGVKELTDSYIGISRNFGLYPRLEVTGIAFHEPTGFRDYVLNYVAKTTHGIDTINKLDTIYMELQIEGKIYKNVYYFSLAKDTFSSGIPLRKNLFYSNSYGLLKYEVNNETWSLCKIKPAR